jgi:hypothetical protein
VPRGGLRVPIETQLILLENFLCVTRLQKPGSFVQRTDWQPAPRDSLSILGGTAGEALVAFLTSHGTHDLWSRAKAWFAKLPAAPEL